MDAKCAGVVGDGGIGGGGVLVAAAPRVTATRAGDEGQLSVDMQFRVA